MLPEPGPLPAGCGSGGHNDMPWMTPPCVAMTTGWSVATVDMISIPQTPCPWCWRTPSCRCARRARPSARSWTRSWAELSRHTAAVTDGRTSLSLVARMWHETNAGSNLRPPGKSKTPAEQGLCKWPGPASIRRPRAFQLSRGPFRRTPADGCGRESAGQRHDAVRTRSGPFATSAGCSRDRRALDRPADLALTVTEP